MNPNLLVLITILSCMLISCGKETPTEAETETETETETDAYTLNIDYPDESFGLAPSDFQEFSLNKENPTVIKFNMPESEVVLIALKGKARTHCSANIIYQNGKIVASLTPFEDSRINQVLNKGSYSMEIYSSDNTINTIKIETMRFSRKETEEARKKLEK